MADAERHHEGERGELDGDRMRGQLGRSDEAHQENGHVEDRYLEEQRRGHGKAELPQSFETIHLDTEQAVEHAIAGKAGVPCDDSHEGRQHECACHDGRDTGAGDAERLEAAAAEKKAPVAGSIDQNSGAADDE